MWDTSVDWNRRFQQACKLARGEDFESALAGMLACVEAEPHRSDFAGEFLATLIKRGLPPPPEQGLESRSLADVHPAHADVLKTLPRTLLQKPDDIETIYVIAQAHLGSGHRPVALKYVDYALQLAPRNLGLLRLRARILTHLHHDQAAIDCWKEVEALNPEGADAVRSITHLVMRRARRAAGWTRGDPLPHDIPAEPPVAQPAAEMPAVVRNALYDREEGPIRLTPVQKLQQALRDSPSLVELYEYIVPLYLEKGLVYDAEKLLHKGIEATDDDPRVRQLWEEASMLRHEKRIAELRDEIRENPLAHLVQELAQLEVERDLLGLEIYGHRAQREPQNYEVQFRYGLRLKQAGRLPEACTAFERAAAAESHLCAASFELGECLEPLGELARALMSYQRALDAAPSTATAGYRKRALFAAGRLAKQIRLYKTSGRYFRELLQIDPQNLDAAAQLHGLAGAKT